MMHAIHRGNVPTFHELGTGMDSFVDWALMEEPIWKNTPEDPDRCQRRMAECLAHRSVRWPSIKEIAAATQPVADEARAILASLGMEGPISVRPQWYF
jgi:hypothetical protein